MEIQLKQGTSLKVNDEVSLILTADTTFDLPAIDEQHFAELVQASKLGASIVTAPIEGPVAEVPVAPKPAKKVPAKAKAPAKTPAKKAAPATKKKK